MNELNFVLIVACITVMGLLACMIAVYNICRANQEELKEELDTINIRLEVMEEGLQDVMEENIDMERNIRSINSFLNR